MYNPFDMIEILINGERQFARPYEFDSDIVDQKNMKNAFGKYVKPTKAITTCNKCGQGVVIDLKLDDPPFSIVTAACERCTPKSPKLGNPFINPVTAKVVSKVELDPILLDTKTKLEPVTTTVAERIEKKKKPAKPKESSKSKGEAKEEKKDTVSEEMLVPKVSKRVVELPPAEDMGAEQSFDDNDLIEP